jgi:hypothetical protein
MGLKLRRVWRLFLATALVVATQVSLLHPLQHFPQPDLHDRAVTSADEHHPAERVHAKQCEMCVASASLGAAAAGNVRLQFSVPTSRSAASAEAHPFIAAFAPLFRAQAPPVLL